MMLAGGAVQSSHTAIAGNLVLTNWGVTAIVLSAYQSD